jgi:hypothetical protein
MNTTASSKSQKKPTRLFSDQGAFGRFCDRCMYPLMLWLQDSKYEEPQRTHFWNWVKIPKCLAYWMISRDKMQTVAGDPKACERYWFPMPRFHMPRFGGWNLYVVLTPSQKEWKEGDVWYVGWLDDAGQLCVSIIPLYTPVRMMRGPQRTKFFALNSRHRQIAVHATSYGQICRAPPHEAELPVR